MRDTRTAATDPTGRPGALGWTLFSLLGISAWVGVTVYVAATNDDPSDATPILRTFALAGAVFFAVVFVGAAIGMRRGAMKVNEGLYRRLALTEVPPGAVRAAARRSLRTGHTYLLFGGVTTALMLTIIGLGERGPYEIMFGALAVLVVGWVGYAVFTLRRAFRASGDLLAPLSLSIVETPTWTPAGGGRLVGRLTMAGVRHGRQIRISHTTGDAVTSIAGDFPRRSLTSATTMASMTGQPARAWRGVTVQVGREGVTVRRAGNGAGRWYLYDLLLAEHLTPAVSRGG